MRVKVDELDAEVAPLRAEPVVLTVPPHAATAVPLMLAFGDDIAPRAPSALQNCPILMHEDHGMMQAVETVRRAADTTYQPRASVARHVMPVEDVDRICPPPSPDMMYRQSMSFVDASPELGQASPAFRSRRWTTSGHRLEVTREVVRDGADGNSFDEVIELALDPFTLRDRAMRTSHGDV